MAARYILAFDTSAAHCAAALLRGTECVAARLEPMEKGQAERLMPMLEEMLAGAGIGWRDLSSLAVGIGPGNFTGVRIAVAAARGLALGLGIPAHGVTRLEALAHGLPRPILVIEDARRGEAYVQGFGLPDHAEARLVVLSDLGGLPAGTALTGSAAGAVSALFGGGPAHPVLPPALPLAEAIAREALARPAPTARPAPFYMRAADAAPPSDLPPVILP